MAFSEIKVIKMACQGDPSTVNSKRKLRRAFPGKHASSLKYSFVFQTCGKGIFCQQTTGLILATHC